MIDDLMGRYSCYEHSQSGESPVDVPLPDERENDIKLWTYIIKNEPDAWIAYANRGSIYT